MNAPAEILHRMQTGLNYKGHTINIRQSSGRFIVDGLYSFKTLKAARACIDRMAKW